MQERNSNQRELLRNAAAVPANAVQIKRFTTSSAVDSRTFTTRAQDYSRELAKLLPVQARLAERQFLVKAVFHLLSSGEEDHQLLTYFRSLDTQFVVSVAKAVCEQIGNHFAAESLVFMAQDPFGSALFVFMEQAAHRKAHPLCLGHLPSVMQVHPGKVTQFLAAQSPPPL